jgi:hypothetical protein
MEDILHNLPVWWSTFNWGIAAIMFAISVLVDVFVVKHVHYVNNKRAAKASNSSVAISALGMISTLIFVDNPLYTIPILLGVWLGTYLPIKYSTGEKDT